MPLRFLSDCFASVTTLTERALDACIGYIGRYVKLIPKNYAQVVLYFAHD